MKNNENQVMKSMNITNKQLEQIIRIQRYWRGKLMRTRLKRILKTMKKRQYVAKELLTSQRKYCQDLQFIIKQIIDPSFNLLSVEERQILFGNVKQISLIHSYFLQRLETTMENYNANTTILSENLLNDLFEKQQFYTMYTSYCFNYKRADQIIKSRMLKNLEFMGFLKTIIARIPTFNLEAYLIKPVQRLCKYKLILKEYFKNMQSFHNDYNDIQRTIQLIASLVTKTNEEVEHFLFQQKYRELMQSYPNLLKNSNQNRSIVSQMDEISIVNVTKGHNIICDQVIIFNDSILALTQKQNPIFVFLKIIKNQMDMKHYKKLVQIIDDTKYITLKFQNKQRKEEFLSICNSKTNFKQKKYLKNYILANILGTEQRQSFFKFYTVYIVQTERNGIKNIVYPRFKQLLRVQQLIIQKGIFTNTPLLQKQSIAATRRSKTIEKRKLHIQEFLQRILNNKAIKKIPEVWEVVCLFMPNQDQLDFKGHCEEEIIVYLPNMQIVKVRINVKSAKIRDLKKLVARELDLNYRGQFQIFEVRNRNLDTKKLMYDDEAVLKIYTQQQSLLCNINPFSDSIDYYYSRHYYFPQEQQYSLYKQDFIRAQLQLAFIRQKVHSFMLDDQMMITFMCLFAIYVNLPIEEDDKLITFIKDVSKKRLKLKPSQFRVYYEQVQRIVTEQEDEMVTVPFIIIKIMSKIFLYQMHQFDVIIHSSCYKQLKSYISQLRQSLILGIKHNNIYFLQTDNKIISTFQLSKVEIAQIHPKGIIFKISNIPINIRIKTSQAYEISKLIEIYSNQYKT